MGPCSHRISVLIRELAVLSRKVTARRWLSANQEERSHQKRPVRDLTSDFQPPERGEKYISVV